VVAVVGELRGKPVVERGDDVGMPGDRLLHDGERASRTERPEGGRKLRDHAVAERDPHGQLRTERRDRRRRHDVYPA